MMTAFNDWKINRQTAESPDGKYILWVANGFSCFKDFEHSTHHTESLLTGVGMHMKRKIWKEFCEERNERRQSFINKLNN